MSSTILTPQMLAIMARLTGSEAELSVLLEKRAETSPANRSITDIIEDCAKRVQVRLGARHLESAYKNLLVAYMKKELPNCEIEVEKKIDLVVDDINIGSRREDVYIKTPTGGIVLELKHLMPDTNSANFPGEDQLKFYMRMDPDKPTIGMCIAFFKQFGYPENLVAIYPNQFDKVKFKIIT